VKNVDDLMYISYQHEDMRIKTKREANENIEQKAVKFFIIEKNIYLDSQGI